MQEFSNTILSLPRYVKQFLAVITDITLCILCTWLAYVLRLEEFILFKDLNFIPVLISIIIAIPIFWQFRLYRSISRYFDLPMIFVILVPTFIYGFLYFLVIGVYTIQGVPRSISIIQPILLFLAIIISRFGVKYILTGNYNSKININKKNVLIYGAGNAGRQLVAALENSPEFKVIGLLDDNDQLHRRSLLGQTIYPSSQLENLVRSKNVRHVFLALPKINRGRRNQIIDSLNQYKLSVKTLPSISEIVDGRISVSDIKDLNIDDL